MRRLFIVSAVALGALTSSVAVASADTTAAPPVANCGFLSSLVACQIPVSVPVGPIGPFNFNFPNGVFGPPPGPVGTPALNG